MSRRSTVALLVALAASVLGNVVMAVVLVRAWRDRPQPIMCRDSELAAYSPGAILLVEGVLKRCKVAGVWVDRDGWGRSLGEPPESAADPEPGG